MDDNRAREILVVEDDPFVRDFAVTMLEENGFQVRSAESADAALELLNENGGSAAVVFTDVQMPGTLDGVQLAHIVRKRWPAVKVLVTSGTAATNRPLPPEIRFLPKPWNADTVVSTIRNCVAGGH